MKRVRRKSKKVTKKSKFLLMFMLLLCAGGYFCCSPFFNIAEINLVGNDKLERTSILSAAQLAEGVNIFTINKTETQKKIKSLHYVDQVIVTRTLPNKVNIEIKESVVAAYVPLMGNFVGIDGKGKILQSVSPSERLNLPTFYGVNAKEFNVGEKIKLDQTEKFDIILLYINSIQNSDYRGKVTQVDVSNLENVTITLWDKLDVNVGDEEKLDYKLKYLKEMVAQIGDEAEGTINLQNTTRASFRAKRLLDDIGAESGEQGVDSGVVEG